MLLHINFIITKGDEVGGAQIHVRDLSVAMINLGFRVEVIVGKRGRFSELLKSADVPTIICDSFVRQISPNQDCKTLRFLKNHLYKSKPDIVALHSSKAGILGRLACRSCRVPCVFTAHGWSFTEGARRIHRILYRTIEKSMARFANRIICVSSYDYKLGLKAGIPATKMVQIHNGINMQNISTFRSHSELKGRPLRAVMVARFGIPKDHNSLLRAVAFVPDLHLDLVGEGPNLEAVKREASNRGITDRVRFLGYQSKTEAALQAADIFCLISDYEGFPYTILEAMREALPCIVSDVGGAGEAVVNGKTGFLIPKGRNDILAQRLEVLVKDAALRLEMGAAAHARFKSNFTFDLMLKKTLKIYEQILIESTPD